MKTYVLISFIITLFCCNRLYSQEMSEGFKMLEKGQFREAQVFFNQVLQGFPNNKTAKLCYARATGLNDNPRLAKNMFVDLLDEYPNDFEIKLNYAESLLWNKEFQQAKEYYEKLLGSQPNSFPAVLGYSNTLSNLKLYDQAIIYINKALELEPNNANALTSKKYIHLGYSDSLVKNQKTQAAINTLNEVNKLIKEDTELLQVLANTYLISEKIDSAFITYKRINKTRTDSIISLNGIALVQHLKNQDKKALKTASKSLSLITSNIEPNTVARTHERYVQALIWNSKYKKARDKIEMLLNDYGNENWILALRATNNVYKSNFKSSIKDYDKILNNDSLSFDGNLGKANSLKALGLYQQAYLKGIQTLDIFNQQKDVTKFLKNIDQSFTPYLNFKPSYSFDNGENEAYSSQLTLKVPMSAKWELLADYTYRNTSNDLLSTTATAHSFQLGSKYTIIPKIDLKGLLGVINTNSENTNQSQVVTNLSLNINALKLQSLSLGYQRTLESFNAALLDRQLIQNNYYVNYNLSTNFNLGWFTQYYYTSQNDNNTRNLLFTSLYYNIFKKPVLKAGVNYQYISFKNQVPTTYFSPSSFNAVEIFLNLNRDLNSIKINQWYYDINLATGLQVIEDNPSQSTYRVQAKLGYKLSDRAFIDLYGLQSNIASTTTAGFTFTEFGLNLRWYITKRPLFNFSEAKKME
ncbi:hypothetical protein AAT17_07280 [Nonlabens sp. MIC269]|uniref:tetratricopeptide repeat protein n=1 Tax=Nonlabens sp. MIC269 TaxID=1476901 RepID=UPI000722515D|nr:tetratricopeptide repeat protein [Nonlabens sp. MIC269]ALM21036.1 hypothetical protein AAT17_07280 [Nonlabens sp. MIC269]